MLLLLSCCHMVYPAAAQGGAIMLSEVALKNDPFFFGFSQSSSNGSINLALFFPLVSISVRGYLFHILRI